MHVTAVEVALKESLHSPFGPFPVIHPRFLLDSILFLHSSEKSRLEVYQMIAFVTGNRGLEKQFTPLRQLLSFR